MIAEISQTKQLISSLPQGIHTIVGGNFGLPLSPVQLKALSLSRALHCLDKRKNIILLDSPCDSLSEAQERKFFQFLRSEMTPKSTPNPDLTQGSDKVVILTSTRFSTAIHVDRVIVLVDGHIDQEGTYKELVSKPGTFRNQLFSNK